MVRSMLLAERPHEAAVVVDKDDVRLLRVVRSPVALHQRVVHIPGRCAQRQPSQLRYCPHQTYTALPLKATRQGHLLQPSCTVGFGFTTESHLLHPSALRWRTLLRR